MSKLTDSEVKQLVEDDHAFLQSEIARLTAELQQAQQDAKRYRWFRDNNCLDNTGRFSPRTHPTVDAIYAVLDATDPQKVDEAIDAAMASVSPPDNAQAK